MSETIPLLCWEVATPSNKVISVRIGHDYVWHNVKMAIKKEKEPALDGIVADTLNLWKVTVNRLKLESLLESTDYIRSVTNTEPLDPIAFVSTALQDTPHDCVNIIIFRQPSISSVTISPGGSFQVETSPFWCPRFETVTQLFEILMREKLVHVRGTPGCGKTTLMTLLHAYIVKQLPQALVKSVSSWRRIASEQLFERRLLEIDPEFPRQRQPNLCFILFDDGQDSYDDLLLWNSFIKEVCEGKYSQYHIILFCSYGSPSSQPLSYPIGTAPVLPEAARISLWPAESSIGLLLNWSEYVDVVSRFERPLKIEPELLVLIFNWTIGHCGAVVGLLHLLSHLSCQLQSPESLNSAPQKVAEVEQQLTVKDFYDNIPLHVLVRTLDKEAFGRGLPTNSELSAQPDVVALFRTLLGDRKLERRGNDPESGALLKCHRKGWIHAAEIVGGVRYTLPSPLHEACLSWKLDPTDDMPSFTTLFKLSLETISKFKPSQLRKLRVASETTHQPETHYQEEFYNSLLSVTGANVRISPEYASARGPRKAGRIDFFIPIVKWGIEIIRDGKRLLEHAARFTDAGAYDAWLKSEDMEDYILLDCRTEIPGDPHPTIRNLYHVVFQASCQEFVVYDNRLRVVQGPVSLQEKDLNE